MGTTADGGKGSEGRAANGDRPIGTARCQREQHTNAACHTPLHSFAPFAAPLPQILKYTGKEEYDPGDVRREAAARVQALTQGNEDAGTS